VTIEELKVIIKAETADIKRKTQEVRDSLKGLKAQSEKVSQSSQSLEKAHKAAERATKSHNKEVKRLGQELSKSLKQFDRQKEAINRCKLAADRSGAAYDKLADKFAAQKSALADQNSKVAQLEKTYQKLSKAMNQYGTYDEMQSTEQGLTKQLSDLIQQRRSMEEAAKYMQQSGSKTTLTSEGVMNKEQLAAAMKRNSLATEELQAKLYGVRDAIEQVQNAGLKKLDDNGLDRMSRDLDKARQKLRDLEMGLRDTGKRMDIAGQKSADSGRKLAQMKSAASATAGRIGKLSQELKRFSGLKGALTGVKEKLKGIGDSAKKSVSGMRSAKKEANALVRAFGLLGTMLKFTAATMIISAAMQGAAEGFKNLSQYSDRTNRDLSQLMSALTQLKNSFAAAFAPVLSVVGPILSKLIGWLSSAMNALAHFFAALTGQSKVVVAKKVNQDFASSVADTGSAADEAKKKAEKYKKTLVGFDQINKLDEPDENKGSGDSGGSGGDLSPGDMFETVEIDNKWANWADKFKEAWAKADFTEIGAMVGEKLNKALESIPWDKIKATSAKIAKSIATFLNGFIAATDWALVGGTLAEALNTVIEFVYTFVTTFDWKKFGVAIGTAINGFFAKLDLAKAGKTLSEAVKGVLDTAINAVETIDWRQIGQKVADFICNIDWIGIGKKIITFLGNAIVGGLNLLGGFVDRMGEWLANYVSSVRIFVDMGDWAKTILEWTGKIIVALGNLALSIGGAAFNLGKALIEAAWNGIKALWGSVKSWFENNFKLPQIKAKFADTKESIATKWHNIVSSVKDKLASMKAKVATKGESIRSKWSSVTKWWKDKTSSLKLSVLAKADGVKATINSIIDKINRSVIAKIKLQVPKSWPVIGGFKIGPPPSIPKFAKGGFPEDGPFMMNRGEIAGKFHNGKSVVANNQQITDGIAAAVYQAFMAANNGTGDGVSSAEFRSSVRSILDAIKEVSFYIGDEQIARHANKGNSRLDRRLNPIQAR